MKNWRTTMFGVLGAAMQGAMGAVQLGAGDNKAGWTNVALAGVWAALGYFAKDSAVTGTGA